MTDWREMLSADVLTLGMAADEARRAQPRGNIVTYTRVHVVSAGDLRNSHDIPQAASEVRLHDTPEMLDEALALVRQLRVIAGTRRVSAFSMAEIEQRQWAGDALRQLVGAGLDDVAELPVDCVEDLAASIRALRDAGADPRRVTVLQPVSDRKAEIISAVRNAIAAAASAAGFAPLPRVTQVEKPTTGYDDLRMIALARLALGTTSIEVDWSLYGPKLAQVALTFGADHLDAVPATDDPALGPRRATVEDVERNIKAAGFAAQEHRASPALR
jgi:aminodeoxyfutalosine synthase